MKIKLRLSLLVIAIMAVVVTGIAATLPRRASGISLNSGMRYLEFTDIEKDLGFDPAFDVNNGFVVNPYQTASPEQNQAVIIGASVSYILREVKSFTMFAVLLAVFALIAYAIIAFIVFDKIARPTVKAEEPQKDVSDKEQGGAGSSNNNNDLNNYIEQQASPAARLSLDIDDMLSDISSVMEKSRVKWSLLL